MQKELGCKLKEKEIWIFFAMVVCVTWIASINNAYAEELETIQFEIKYTNGDRVDNNGVKIIVYQDFNKSPILEKNLQSNPDFISVPENHRYKIEVYVNGMYADVAYVQLKNNSEKLDIDIPLSGGLQFEVLYKNGHPISGATVILKSQDNEEWRKGTTNDEGKTLRYWVQSTIKQENYYTADVYLGEIFLTSYFPIKLQPGIAFDQKIITNIPENVEELITVNLFAGVKEITSDDGKYKVTLTDLNGNYVDSSEVNYRGDAYFSNLKSGSYIVKITSNNVIEDTLWPQQNIHIIGDVNKFNIFRDVDNINVQDKPFLSCGCIAFRLDDIQDYWLADTQIELIDLFAKKNIPLTIGVIGNVTGSDPKLTSVIKENLKKNNLEIANHSWNNDILTSIDKNLQEKYILDTNNRIFQVYGETPRVFIPPQNLYNKDTIEILKNNGFTHLISHVKDNSQTSMDDDLHIVPATTETGKLSERVSWKLHEITDIKDQITKNIEQRGYSIIMIHPQEFSLNDIGEYDGPNQKSLSDLSQMLDEISKFDSKIVKISEIKSSYEKSDNTTKQEVLSDTCNCVAFRLDGVQDYWLNDVQISIMNTFIENKTPITIGIIANAFGNDKKITKFVKESVEKKETGFEVATKGIGLTPYTNYDKIEQNENLKKSIELINSTINVKPHVFIPPDNKFNADTFDILKENNITHISTSLISGDEPPFEFKGKEVYRFPQITSTGKFNSTSNVFEGVTSQQVVKESIQGIKNYGFAVVSIQPQEFAMIINSTYVNIINQKQIDELTNMINDFTKKGYKIVPIGKINSNLVVRVPEWIKSNAGWWANGGIDDNTFVQGIEYLVKNGIIHVTEKSQTTSNKQTIPKWIKSNAGWWANGDIDDNTFVQGIEYLVKNGIITY